MLPTQWLQCEGYNNTYSSFTEWETDFHERNKDLVKMHPARYMDVYTHERLTLLMRSVKKIPCGVLPPLGNPHLWTLPYLVPSAPVEPGPTATAWDKELYNLRQQYHSALENRERLQSLANEASQRVHQIGLSIDNVLYHMRAVYASTVETVGAHEAATTEAKEAAEEGGPDSEAAVADMV